jgi:hypothetical protein
MQMQVIGVLLLLLSVGLVVAPVGAVVYIYKDDLTGLVVPPEIKGAINGDACFILNDNMASIDGYGDGNDPSAVFNNFVTPTFVDANVDKNTNTFSFRVNVTNPLNYDLTLNELSTEVQSIQGETLASVTLPHPFTIVSGESTIVQVDGTWTQAGDTFITDHWYDSSITIALANIFVDVNGIQVERNQPLTVSLPITLSGVLVG